MIKLEKFIGRSALLIIDAQKEFVESVYDSMRAVQAIQRALNAARKAHVPIIFSKEIHRKSNIDFGRELDGSEGIHCLEDTDGINIVEQLHPISGEYIIVKRRYSCFFATDLLLLLKGLHVQTLIICGFLTDVCVHYTCVDAHQYDYYIRVLYDGVRGSSKEAQSASLKAIKYLQRDSETWTNEVIDYFKEAEQR